MLKQKHRSFFSILALNLVLCLHSHPQDIRENPLSYADGYRGIWYMNQPSNDRYVYKYSGGLGTYCAKHIPLAWYAPEVKKTFFVYGGTRGIHQKNSLLIMASYFDHQTGMVPKPVIVMEKNTDDAHHNPSLCIDGDGYLWIFASAHGGKDGYIWKSKSPYSIHGFKLVRQREFTYPQPRFLDDIGILLLFTKYSRGREIYMSSSKNGFDPQADRKLVGFAGHYQISGQYRQVRGSAFNWHPTRRIEDAQTQKGNLNERTNLYYMQTRNGGQTWETVDGIPLKMPLDHPLNKALVRNYQQENFVVYLKDINYDRHGHPVILHLISRGYQSGPQSGKRTWMIAKWTGKKWDFYPVTTSDHNYDTGSLYTENDQSWRIIAPTEPGPQAYGTGGEVVLWESLDQGKTWYKRKQITRNSPRNHTYIRRPVNAHPDFYAFWADGNAFKPSVSRFYFTNRNGDAVWMLPVKMQNEFEKPFARIINP